MNIHFEYIDKMIVAEAKRTDFNREKIIAQVLALASQVASSDESNRILIENINDQLDERVTVLEKSKYESEGRKGLSTSLLMMISGLIGGLIVFIIQKLISL